ncbi:decapping endonuclease targeting mRNA [Dinochytrium kinnereticum]|nr:decapping endonuclease targeting mRNA [Dinochytrium kinnereticum]
MTRNWYSKALGYIAMINGLKKYYYAPELSSCHLSTGFPDRYITRASVPERLDALIECLSTINKDKASEGQPSNTIYIMEHETEERKRQSFGNTDRDKLMTYWGYRFESLSTISKPPCEIYGPNDEELVERRDRGIVNTNIQFCSVFRTKLGDNEIVMGAEVDCMLTDSAPKANRQKYYAELKTNRIIQTKRQQISFEKFKLLKVYFQSWLAGIPKVIFGYRDDDGWVRSIDIFKTMELPRMVRGKDHAWDPVICINFANGFLTRLALILRRQYESGEGDRNAVHTIRYNPDVKAIEVFEAVHHGPDVFVPEDI